MGRKESVERFGHEVVRRKPVYVGELDQFTVACRVQAHRQVVDHRVGFAGPLLDGILYNFEHAPS